MSAGIEPGAAPTQSPAIRAGFTAIIDQFLFVGASSIMVFLLGRALSANEYGGFVIAYTTFLLLGQAQTALFAEPMTVFAPSRYQGQADAYVRAVERLNLRVGLLAGAAFVVLSGVMAALGHRPTASAFFGAGIAGPALLALWLRRRTLYLQGRIGRSVAASAVFLAVGVTGIVTLYRLGGLGAFSGMVTLGAASVIGLLASWPPRVPHEPDPPGIVHAHWEYGRWSLLTALLGWCGNLYYFLLPLKHGLESAAALRALMNFVYPVLQTNQALTLLLLPRWAAHDSRAGFSRSLSRLTWIWTTFSLALCAGALVGGPSIVHWVYAGRYDSVAALLPWVFLLVLPDGICYLIANGLRASRAPRRVALAAIALAVVAVFPGVPLTYVWGLRGAVAALLVASVTQLGLVWRGWRQPEAGENVQP